MKPDAPPRTLSDMIKACGMLVVYAGFALPFFDLSLSGNWLGAIVILGIAHLVARAFAALIF